MKNAAAKLTCIMLTFNITFLNRSHGDIKRRCIIQLFWISLFSKSSWIKTTAKGLSSELGVNGENVTGNWDIINKNGHSTFHTGNNLEILTV